jgi:uridylate kinase
LKVVIKIGGHVFASEPDVKGIKEYSELLRKLNDDGHKVVAVMGGGEEARKYIQIAKKLGGSELICDIFGIEVSRLNARLLITALGEDAYPEPPVSIEDLMKAFEGGKIVVMGGLQPGHSTNAVGILAAEAIGADLFVNATNVDGVYTSDPKKDPKARKLNIIKTDELLSLTSIKRIEAGSYSLFDPVAIRIVERSHIPTRIVDGRNPKNIERAIRGEAVGTLIKSAEEDET